MFPQDLTQLREKKKILELGDADSGEELGTVVVSD